MLIGHVQIDNEIKCNTMHVPPFETNILIGMWYLVTTCHILVTNFHEYVKVIELAMVQIVVVCKMKTNFLL
jgi:hypothetical protein